MASKTTDTSKADAAKMREAASELNRAFLTDLEALPPESWGRPSDCEGWTAAGVVVHMTQVAELYADAVTRGRGGDAGPPPQAAQGIQAWRAWRAERHKERVARPATEVLNGYRAAAARVEQVVDDARRDAPETRAWHPAGPQSLDWWAGQWLFELALHDWDLRVAADPAAEPRREAMAAFARAIAPRLSRGFAGGDDPDVAGRYRIELTELDSPSEAEPLAFVVRVGDGRVEVEPGSDDGADATIRTDPAALALVMTNRRPVDQFAAAGRWEVSGDDKRADAFARAFQSY